MQTLVLAQPKMGLWKFREIEEPNYMAVSVEIGGALPFREAGLPRLHGGRDRPPEEFRGLPQDDAGTGPQWSVVQ